MNNKGVILDDSSILIKNDTDSIIIDELEILWSKPDSVGVQYKLKSNIKTTKHFSKNEEINQKHNKFKTFDTTSVTIRDKTTQKKESNSSKNKEKSISYLSVISILILLVLVCFLYKRFKK